ncbi:MAG: rod-binding protein [Thermodesulfobacteriota bacterium]|nr:rod-binding protein [Thermodesulfobacteriota bacterium]
MDTDVINQHFGGAVLEKLTGTDLKKSENRELKEACQGFESIFLNSLMKAMRSTLPGETLFKENNGMDIYKSMYDQHLAEEIAHGRHGTGIGEYLYKDLQNRSDK